MIGTIGIVLIAFAVLWFYGAILAGIFAGERHVVVSDTSLQGVEPFSLRKRFAAIGEAKVAYIDEGQGPAVLLLHGCPFQSYEWKDVIPLLSEKYRVIAPDLLGLGDTVVFQDADYRLPRQMEMVLGLLDHLGIKHTHVVGHDHGGAIAQMLMKHHPERLLSVVLTNVEAYDQWPSNRERADVELVVNPLTSPLFRIAITIKPLQRWIYRIAVAEQKTLTDDVLFAFVRPHISSTRRWRRLRRFLRWQLDREHNSETLRVVDGLRAFTKPTLLLWGGLDQNFDLDIARRLEKDIPGVVRLVALEKSAHLPMLEQPQLYGTSLLAFLNDTQKSS
ncbi:MAG: alpha/beta hydrolase [Nitrospiraceae bacterium]|nr:alpha/beta hydrolase [Nitrospiraceae bacterium]